MYPTNIEFISHINGLESIEEVRNIVFNANNLVTRLGDIKPEALVAAPLDPRHRPVTFKYNPARIWTSENAIGIVSGRISRILCCEGDQIRQGQELVIIDTEIGTKYEQD